MRIAGTVQDSIVDGPGLRFTVFTQGCPHRCKGCHNPETHDPNGGYDAEVSELVEKMRSNPLTDGLTLSGGEPFLQAAECAQLAIAAKAHGLNVWTYSGYTYEQLLVRAREDNAVTMLLESTDVLVDGAYEQELRSLELAWRGSKNQRVIDLNATREYGEIVEKR